MKNIYQGFLFVAFLAVAICGVGGTEPTEGVFPLIMIVLLAIVGLMYKAGMMAKPISKEKYDRIYKKQQL